MSAHPNPFQKNARKKLPFGLSKKEFTLINNKESMQVQYLTYFAPYRVSYNITKTKCKCRTHLGWMYNVSSNSHLLPEIPATPFLMFLLLPSEILYTPSNNPIQWLFSLCLCRWSCLDPLVLSRCAAYINADSNSDRNIYKCIADSLRSAHSQMILFLRYPQLRTNRRLQSTGMWFFHLR